MAQAPAGVLPSANQWFQNANNTYLPQDMYTATPGINDMQQNAWGTSLQAGSQGIADAKANQRNAQGLQNQYNQFAQGGNQLQNDWSQWDNPAFQDSVQGYQNSMWDQFDRGYMQDSKLRNASSMGGTRQGIAQGIAMSDLNNQVNQQTSNMYSDQYNRGMDRYLTADRSNQTARQGAMNGMLPFGQNTMQAQTGIGNSIGNMAGIEGAIGNMQYDQSGKYMDEAVTRHQYNQAVPLNNLKEYANIVGTVGGMGGLSTGDNPNQSNLLANAIGGAYMGSSIGKGFFDEPNAIAGDGNIQSAYANDWWGR